MSEIDLMDGHEAAEYIKVLSYWTILELAKQGKCPCIRIGRRVFFRKESLDQWLNELETGGKLKEVPLEYGKLRKIMA